MEIAAGVYGLVAVGLSTGEGFVRCPSSSQPSRRQDIKLKSLAVAMLVAFSAPALAQTTPPAKGAGKANNAAVKADRDKLKADKETIQAAKAAKAKGDAKK